jgi:hypothetical protein
MLIRRIKNYCDLTEFSRIPGGSQTFGCRVDLSHFLGWRAGTNSRYSVGEGPPIKAGQQQLLPHLETPCEIHHIYEEQNESSSAGPGRSQQLEIPPSLHRPLAFPVPPAFPVLPAFPAMAAFLQTLVFYQARGFQRPQGFYRPPDFLWPRGFCLSPKFLWSQGF